MLGAAAALLSGLFHQECDTTTLETSLAAVSLCGGVPSDISISKMPKTSGFFFPLGRCFLLMTLSGEHSCARFTPGASLSPHG